MSVDIEYPHEWTAAYRGEPYCAHCRLIIERVESPECLRHPSRPLPTYPITPILPGDVIEAPFGIMRTTERWIVHETVQLRDGSYSLRARPLSNPRAIDWSLYVAPAEPELRILSRGVAAVDASVRVLMPM